MSLQSQVMALQRAPAFTGSTTPTLPQPSAEQEAAAARRVEHETRRESLLAQPLIAAS